MHTKINIHQNDPNFLTHVIWSKTSLGMQHIHLEILWNLSYVFSMKIKHNSRIIISDNYKILIIPPEMCFGITREYVKVGCKNLIIFSYKNHLCRFCRNENNFYKKIYNITLCNFWYRSWSWHNTQHIQNLAIEDLWILRYCRSKFFTFLFFMQKLSGTSSGKNNKSCRIFTTNPITLSLHFSDSSTIFYGFYKILQNNNTIWDPLLHRGPWKDSGSYKYALTLRMSPWK
jgi:hypothetical protein